MINGWKNERIGNLVYIVNGGTPSTNIQEYWNGDIIWVTPSDITKRKSKYIDIVKRY
jgi:type I restriction enzyme S subunit